MGERKSRGRSGDNDVRRQSNERWKKMRFYANGENLNFRQSCWSVSAKSARSFPFLGKSIHIIGENSSQVFPISSEKYFRYATPYMKIFSVLCNLFVVANMAYEYARIESNENILGHNWRPTEWFWMDFRSIFGEIGFLTEIYWGNFASDAVCARAYRQNSACSENENVVVVVA